MRNPNRILAPLPLVLALALFAGCPKDDDGNPPPPLPAPVATSNAKSLDTVDGWGSAFPSDMELVDTDALRGTLFVNDEATVEAAGGARVLALDLDTQGMPPSTVYGGFQLQKTDLIHPGGTGVQASDTFGSWMSQATTEDLLIVSETAGFFLACASHEGDPPFLANVFLFNPTNSTLTQSVNLAVSYAAGGLTRSDGTSIASFDQTSASGLAFVSTGATTGKLYVSMSNLYSAAGMNNIVFNPGTVQVLDVDFSAGPPITTPATTIVRPTKWNPVHVTSYTSPATGKTFVLVSNGGITEYYGQPPWGFSPPYTTFSQTESSIEVVDPVGDTIVASISLGLAPLAMNGIAVGRDGTGRTVGMIGSKFYGHVYTMDLSGLDHDPIEPGTIRPFRSAYHPVEVFTSNQGGDHTWAVDVALSPNGRYAFVGAFNQAEVHVLACPGDWETGDFIVHPAPFTQPFAFTALDSGKPNVTRILFRCGDFTGPDILVLQSNTELSMTPTNLKYGGIGTIDTFGRTR